MKLIPSASQSEALHIVNVNTNITKIKSIDSVFSYKKKRLISLFPASEFHNIGAIFMLFSNIAHPYLSGTILTWFWMKKYCTPIYGNIPHHTHTHMLVYPEQYTGK